MHADVVLKEIDRYRAILSGMDESRSAPYPNTHEFDGNLERLWAHCLWVLDQAEEALLTGDGEAAALLCGFVQGALWQHRLILFSDVQECTL